MANTFTGNAWNIDTTEAGNLYLGRVKIKSIVATNATAGTLQANALIDNNSVDIVLGAIDILTLTRQTIVDFGDGQWFEGLGPYTASDDVTYTIFVA